MAEVVGSVITVAGLSSLLSTCLHILDVISETNNYDQSVQDILMDMDYQQWTFILWGQDVGLLNHTDSTPYNNRLDDPATMKMVYNHLNRLKCIFDDLRKLKENYGIMPGPQTSMDTLPALLDVESCRKNIERRTKSRENHEFAGGKTLLELHRKSKLRVLVADLQMFNDQLHRLVPVSDFSLETRILESVEASFARHFAKNKPGTPRSNEGPSLRSNRKFTPSFMSNGSSVSIVLSYRPALARIQSSTVSLRATRSSTDLAADMEEAQDSEFSPIFGGPERKSSAVHGQMLHNKKRSLPTLPRWTYTTRFAVLITLAESRLAFNRQDDAAKIYEGVLEDQMKVLEEYHLDALHTAKTLASIYRVRNELSKAESLYMHAMDGEKLVLGEVPADTLSETYKVALAYQKMERHSEAGDIFQRIYLIDKKQAGEVGDWLQNLVLYHMAQKYNSFNNLPDDAEDANVLSMMREVANSYLFNKRLDDAATILNDLLGIEKSVHGRESQITLLAMRDLAKAYRG
ncbi:hypothetical protein RUND412_002035 [Rhizina undulata]